jgi:TonB-linked SusC/RagA family outer membrane protein
MKYYLALIFIFQVVLGLSQVTVGGRVQDAEGLALVGVTIRVQGSSGGATTNADGRFEVQVENLKASLSFSYVGYASVTIPLEGKRVVEVTMVESASLMDEVVVVGYGSQKRSNISGAVSMITAEEIAELPILRMEQALQGRAAGVQVTQNSGSPGSTLTVRVRGTGTINNAEPLYLVDGIPVDGLDFLNPNDIESINVLKDAASSAIYGARGANGVVLITTRVGKKNQEGKITYDAYVGLQQTWKKTNLLSASEYAILSNEAHVAAGLVPYAEFSDPTILGSGTDWLGALFETAPMSSHQLAVTGGSEKSAYSLSGNYFSQEGIVGGDKAGFRRYTCRINTSHDVKRWLSVGTSAGFTSLTRNGLPENNEFATPLVRALNMDPVTPVRKSDGTFAYSRYSDTDITNPINAIEQTHDTWRSNRLVGGVFGELNLGGGFKARSTYSVDATFATQDIFYPRFDLSNDVILSDAPAQEKRQINSVVKNNNTWTGWQWENVLSWEQVFRSRHVVGVTAGTTALYNRHEYSGGANTNLPSNDPRDAYISNTIDPIASQSTYGGAGESALESYFSRLNYALDDRYLFSAVFRVDGSSRFGANNRFGYFPSLSAAWVLSHEPFWKSELVNFMKIRSSWGRNGNDKIGNYSFTTVVYSGQNYTFGPNQVITNGSVALRSANPDLKWETVEQTNLGIDVELLNGRLGLTADYYRKNTLDMLYAAPIPLVAGTEAPVRNVASVRNTGWEVALQYRNRDRALKYAFSGNAAFVHNKVTGLGAGGEPVYAGRVQSANANVTKTEVGRPIGSFFGYVTDGIFQSAAEVEAGAFQNEGTAAGDIRFVDLNGDGVIDEADQTWIGNPSPDFTYGINGELAYKGVDLGFFLQGCSGNDLYNATVRYDFTYVNRPVSALNRWTGPGTSRSEPRVNLSDPNQNARVSDRFVEDGSYLRVKNVQLGYSLPDDLTKRLHLGKFRLYLSGQNLFTFTRYSGMDPEIGAYSGALDAGIDRGFYPQARAYVGGINVVF